MKMTSYVFLPQSCKLLADFLISSLAAVNVISFCTSFYVLASHETNIMECTC